MPDSAASSQNAGSLDRSDASALLGILVVLEGALLSHALDETLADKLATRLADAGVMPASEGDTALAIGRLRVAIAGLNQRLRYSLGEYDTRPSAIQTVAHVVDVSTPATADECAVALGELGARSVRIEHGFKGWRIYAAFPELPPGGDFDARKEEVIRIALRFGGRYVGSEDAS